MCLTYILSRGPDVNVLLKWKRLSRGRWIKIQRPRARLQDPAGRVDTSQTREHAKFLNQHNFCYGPWIWMIFEALESW